MKKILIFGTGVSAQKVLNNLNYDHVDLVGFLDNNVKKQNTYYHEWKIYSPMQGIQKNYDYIIIASVKYELIGKQLIELGVGEDKIICYFAFDHSQYGKYRDIIYVDGMYYDELQAQFEFQQRYVANMQYEIADKVMKEKIQIPRVLSIDETIDKLIHERVSFSRFGDGEFDQIAGRREGYQEPDDSLSERLKEVLTIPIEGHIVGLADIYGDLSQLDYKYANYFRNVLLKYREEHYQYIDMNRVYYNAFISRLYSEMKNKEFAKQWFAKSKQIWNERDVVIVEGRETRFGVGNDLLDCANSVKRILGPSEGAFSQYNRILQACIEECRKDDLLLIALGPTATVLAYDMAREGYQAIDIGHFDIEYEWLLRKVQDHKVAIEGKYTNEVVGGNVVADVKDDTYLREIVKIIE